MAWYNTGNIALTNGSATVTGSGTNFLVGAQIGEALYAPDGKLYEIQTINSATVITLASNYLGSTVTGQSYQIIPTQSLVADLASDVTDLISDFANVRDYAGNGKFNDGAVGTPGITFTQDQDNGLYRIGANNWALAAGGIKQVDLSATDVEINYAGVKKLSTSASGIDVTGSVTASADVTISNGNNRFVASSTSTGDYVRMYGGSGTGKWDIYGNGANLRIGDNESAGLVQIDTNLYTVGSVGIGTTAAAGYRMDILGGSGYDDILRITGVGTNIGPRINLTPTGTGISRINATANSLQLQTGGNPALTIDSSQNVKIGTSSGSNKLDIKGTVGFEATNSTNKWLTYTYTDNTLRLNYNGAGADEVVIDSSGNVGIGVVPSTVWSSSYDALQIGLGGSVYAHGGAGSNMQIAANVVYEGLSPNFYDKYLTSSTASKYVQDSGLHIWSTAASGTAGNNIAWSEAMRIGSDGRVSVNTTGNIGGAFLNVEHTTDCIGVNLGPSATGSRYFMYLTYNSVNVGSITGTSTATAFNTSSDQRLKENIADADDAGSKIDAIQVRKFDWKADGSHQDYGMVAQELLEVAPEAVSAPEDPEKMMGVDYSKLVPMMLKEIQSLRARVAALES